METLESLQFLTPLRMWLGLGTVVLIALLYIVAQRRQVDNAKRLINLSLLEAAERYVGGRWRHHVPFVIGIAGFVALSIQLGTPITVERIAHERSRIVLAVDNSLSTMAVELEGGLTRIEQIEESALNVVESAREGDELALVTFADEAILSVEPTLDHQALREVISQLEPQVETDLGGALLEAHRLTQGTPVASHVIVLSDGAGSPGTPVDRALEQLVADKVAVSSVLIGTPGGFTFENDVRRPFPASPTTMERIAEATGGVYVNGSVEELMEVYTNLERTVRFTTEETPMWLPLYAGFVLLIAATSLSTWRRKTPW